MRSPGAPSVNGARNFPNTDAAQEKGYDAGKKVSGTKHHIAVDSQGLPHAVQITTADVGDREVALLIFLLNDDTLSNVDHVMINGGYKGTPFAGHLDSILGATLEVAKRNELHKFAVIPRRWLWNVRLPGWKNVGGCGRTANASSIRVRNSSSLHF